MEINIVFLQRNVNATNSKIFRMC